MINQVGGPDPAVVRNVIPVPHEWVRALPSPALPSVAPYYRNNYNMIMQTQTAWRTLVLESFIGREVCLAGIATWCARATPATTPSTGTMSVGSGPHSGDATLVS